MLAADESKLLSLFSEEGSLFKAYYGEDCF